MSAIVISRDKETGRFSLALLGANNRTEAERDLEIPGSGFEVTEVIPFNEENPEEAALRAVLQLALEAHMLLPFSKKDEVEAGAEPFLLKIFMAGVEAGRKSPAPKTE